MPFKIEPNKNLEYRGNHTRLGDKTSFCLQLKDLFNISTVGFTPTQHAHVRECHSCRMAYSHYMKLRRAEARENRGLKHFYKYMMPDMSRLK